MSKENIMKKWIKAATDSNMQRHFSHFLIIQDKMIGLNPSPKKMKDAHEFVSKKIDECEEKHIILNYIIGVL